MQTNEVLRPDDSTFDYNDHIVLDEHGVRIGVVVDVVQHPDEGSAEYLVVAPGHLRAPHYVPIARSYHTNDGKIVVPWDRH